MRFVAKPAWPSASSIYHLRPGVDRFILGICTKFKHQSFQSASAAGLTFFQMPA